MGEEALLKTEVSIQCNILTHFVHFAHKFKICNLKEWPILHEP